MKSFKNWKISTKIMGISVFTMVVILSGILFYLLPLVEKKLMEEKKSTTKYVTDVTYSMIASLEAKARTGDLKMEDAQKRSIEAARNIRYHTNEYFFIMDEHGKMIMHGVKQELTGKDMKDEIFKDSHGKFFVRELVDVARNKGDGFVDYMFPKPNETKPSPKLSYAKLFALGMDHSHRHLCR